jgi:hypothetical protein
MDRSRGSYRRVLGLVAEARTYAFHEDDPRWAPIDEALKTWGFLAEEEGWLVLPDGQEDAGAH